VCLEAKLILIGSLSSSGKLRLAPEATKAIFANYSTALCSPKLKKNSKFQNWGSEQTRRQSFPEWFGKISKNQKHSLFQALKTKKIKNLESQRPWL